MPLILYVIPGHPLHPGLVNALKDMGQPWEVEMLSKGRHRCPKCEAALVGGRSDRTDYAVCLNCTVGLFLWRDNDGILHTSTDDPSARKRPTK